MHSVLSFLLLFLPVLSLQASQAWKSDEPIANFHLKANYKTSEDGIINFRTGNASIDLKVVSGSNGTLEFAASHKVGEEGRLKTWVNEKEVGEIIKFGKSNEQLNEKTNSSFFISTDKQAKEIFDLSKDFTTYVKFKTTSDGTLFSESAPDKKWLENGKVLYVDSGKLVYDIGWKGQISGGKKVNDGKWHEVALVTDSGNVKLFLDGKLIQSKNNFSADRANETRFQIGKCSTDFGGDFEGEITNLRHWKRALDDNEIKLAVSKRIDETNTPDFNWKSKNIELKSTAASNKIEPIIIDGYLAKEVIISPSSEGINISNVIISKLGDADHFKIVNNWDHNSLDRGARIYNGFCITCHGTDKLEGTLPTALRFHKGQFKNGKDPLSMYSTLTKGYNQMVAQPWMTPQQKWDVIQYIRDTFIKEQNPSQFVEVDERYINTLPRGLDLGPQNSSIFGAEEPKWKKMDYGPVQFWTIQVSPGNIAYKGIAIRLDEGPGGIAKGNKWILYDHDTMRVAAAWTGEGYIDWRGIAFDQSHASHASLVGAKVFENPVGPGIANPKNGSFKDPRFLGRDGKPYGPLPKEWTHYKGTYLHGGRAIIKYTVGDTIIHELPGYEIIGDKIIITRTIEVNSSNEPIRIRIAPSGTSVSIKGNNEITIDKKDGGFHTLNIPTTKNKLSVKVLISELNQSDLNKHLVSSGLPIALNPLTEGSIKRWPDIVTTEGSNGEKNAAFEVDEIKLPTSNPWNSWMRLGGFDFFPDGKKAAVATWLGDVFIVDGIEDTFDKHRWQRIATGLFQPLGVKIIDGSIFITCRDQIAKLHDLNGDNEIDYVESFNNDHQVTEHFHEFAMGLQTDSQGNFYYAKSARHAKTALVPHHGTLIKVSANGEESEIIANGFRAANGVCLNPDGTFIVTDQEGHWNPKNRINYVKKGGFYGNMFGYHDVTDNSDSAMQQPLCWITNSFDRSPGELMWVPEKAKWGALNGKLLNLSYGTGKIFLVPHEKFKGQAQGGMISIGLDFPTGLMRGRFHPENGQLYATGMFAWAGSKRGDGGFYRIRHTQITPNLPTSLKATKDGIELEFTTELDKNKAEELKSYQIKVWDLKRTRNYGSKHYNERLLEVKEVILPKGGRIVRLVIPELKPTWGMSIRYKLKNSKGEEFDGEINNSIHQMPQT